MVDSRSMFLLMFLNTPDLSFMRIVSCTPYIALMVLYSVQDEFYMSCTVRTYPILTLYNLSLNPNISDRAPEIIK